MNRDQLWKALFLPGVAKDYFAFDTIPPFESDHSDYNTANALILAELSRWSYNSEDTEARIQSTGDLFFASLILKKLKYRKLITSCFLKLSQLASCQGW